MKLTTYLSTLKTKGNLKYEYNPFHNYLTDVDIKNENNEVIITAGSLIDFTTDLLNFDLEHPVDIEALPSYDGSVNLIINDNKNIPRLINSRFSVREKNTYEIVDRIGENDTNIYNSKDFEKDTSLYFRYKSSPKIQFTRHINGNLGVGLYCYYFVYCDADDNESDIIAESGLIPIFLGNDSDPFSMDGGIKNLSSNKGIMLRLNKLDSSYNYIKIYQFRYFADYLQNRVYECKKLYHKYPIYSNILYLNITGNEDGEMIDPNVLNLSLFNPNHVLTLAQCKNMLFFGNVVKNTDDYKELTDCALRIVPEVCIDTIPDVTSKYDPVNNSYGYYETVNIYNKTGYFPEEYYRFGVVFIYSNGTLSNVYNTFGYRCYDNKTNMIFTPDFYKKSGSNVNEREYITYDHNGFIPSLTIPFANAKGVIKLDITNVNNNTVLGIKFNIPEEVTKYLKEKLNITGLFFVRQKRIPNIITLCYLMPFDKDLEAPVLKTKNLTEDNTSYKVESFLNLIDSKHLLDLSYKDRLIDYSDNNSSISKNAYAAICPDFLLNLPYYNQIFNGSTFKVAKISSDTDLYYESERLFKRNLRNYFMSLDSDCLKYNSNLGIKKDVKICTVTEDVPTVAIKDLIYRLNIGEAEQPWRFRYARKDNNEISSEENNHELVRGIYSPYLAIYSDSELETGCLYNVYGEKELNYTQEFLDRINSREPFYAISDRYNFEELDFEELSLSESTDSEESNQNNGESNSNDSTDSNKRTYYYLVCYRGDCYNNTFTYRLNRNFNDPTLPNNDKLIGISKKTETDEEVVIDEEPLKFLQYLNNQKDWTKIYRANVNGVKLGSWITIKCKSSMNYALRSTDSSYVSETALMGSERSFYPKSSLREAGENKKPDSYLYNDAYRATLGYKCYFTLNDINYIKNVFSNRIQYSAISILDSYKNNFRYSLSTYFRDYSLEYGSILKLVSFEGYLLVVFEHAICIAVINERILAGTGDGEPVFINTHNVLPEELTVISDTYGTMWPESVVKSEAGYVYGIDTIAKKIWRVKGQQIEILSDFKVEQFLNKNITLGERETTPIIGLKNIKTHYNNNKKDVMFTFYDDVYKDEEKTWNLCYNELLGEFVTFYSWIPSYSTNIDTQFFSFDRNTSKYLSLLRKSNASIEDNTGILVDNPVLKDDTNIFNLSYKPENRKIITKTEDGIIREEYSKDLENIKVTNFIIEKDHWGFWKKLNKTKGTSFWFNESPFNDEHPVIILEVTPELEITVNGVETISYLPTETIALTTELYVEKLKPDFYLHGESGIFDCKESLYPTHWYGEFHPFEFEFVVNDKIALQKIFTNLVMISNKAEPESFHFEIEGDNYEFSSDKRTMYFRLEATKQLYLNLGSNIIYDRYFTDIAANKYTQEQYYRPKDISYWNSSHYLFDKVYPEEKTGLVLQVKSTIFPLYYERVDTYNNIYHNYREMNGGDHYDFKNLSGSEIVWDRILNQLNIVTHIKNLPLSYYGVLRGNSSYKEGKRNILIPSILFSQCNENPWSNPPIIINSNNVPKDITKRNITYDTIPNIYKDDDLRNIVNSDSKWTARKEAKIRDKWMKVRIRYSGKNLAVIHSIITLYNISYS